MLSFLAAIFFLVAHAQMDHSKMNHHGGQHEMTEHKMNWGGASSCKIDEAWDYSLGMCLPLNIDGSEKTFYMIHGNAFLTGIWAEKPRGKDAQFAVPDMIMANVGQAIGQNHFLMLILCLPLNAGPFMKKVIQNFCKLVKVIKMMNPILTSNILIPHQLWE